MTSDIKTIRDKFVKFHALRLFFQGLDDFKELSRQTGFSFDLDRQTIQRHVLWYRR